MAKKAASPTTVTLKHLAAEIADGRLALLRVEGLPLVRQWLVVRARDKRLLPAGQALSDFLAREGSRFLPQVETEGGRCPLPRAQPRLEPRAESRSAPRRLPR